MEKQTDLIVLTILKEYSDLDNPLSGPKIFAIAKEKFPNRINKIETINKSLNKLTEFGFIFKKGPKSGFYYKRELSINDAEILIESIGGSRSLSRKDADYLYNKLLNLFSYGDKEKLKFTSNIIKCNSEFSHACIGKIESINKAITYNCSINFKYLEVAENYKYRQVNKGFTYSSISPFYVVNNRGDYYMLSASKYDEHIQSFRISLMDEITLNDGTVTGKVFEARREIPIINEFKDGEFKVERYLENHVYLNDGPLGSIVVGFYDMKALTYIKDYFGDNANYLGKSGSIHKCVIINDTQSLLYWCKQFSDIVFPLYPEFFCNKLLNSINNYKVCLEKGIQLEKRYRSSNIIKEFSNKRFFVYDDNYLLSITDDDVSRFLEIFNREDLLFEMIHAHKVNSVFRTRDDSPYFLLYSKDCAQAIILLIIYVARLLKKMKEKGIKSSCDGKREQPLEYFYNIFISTDLKNKNIEDYILQFSNFDRANSLTEEFMDLILGRVVRTKKIYPSDEKCIKRLINILDSYFDNNKLTLNVLMFKVVRLRFFFFQD